MLTIDALETATVVGLRYATGPLGNAGSTKACRETVPLNPTLLRETNTSDWAPAPAMSLTTCGSGRRIKFGNGPATEYEIEVELVSPEESPTIRTTLNVLIASNRC